ncbi:MAG TPA: AAA family ATPase [Dictyobacter sp.]|jgi:LuxR family maltose regulon positive regulatory protein|nr:AAA family ATPase [Dictyobacter sp.]
MNTSQPFQQQLLATKFYLPTTSQTLIFRPRLTDLLNEGRKRHLTLISAQAGSGKTTLLSTWAKSLAADHEHIAWVSLDDGDNEPLRFWSYILTALDQQEPGHFTALVKTLHTPPVPSLQSIAHKLINTLAQSKEHWLLILDDYQTITQAEIHASVSFLLGHQAPQLHLFIASRLNLPFSLSALRAHQQLQEIKTEQLRCTVKEGAAFLQQVMKLTLNKNTIQDIINRTEGWLVGLQLFGLTMQGRSSPVDLPNDLSGNQRYILDYLTDEVIEQQSPEVQTFLLYTSILEKLTAPLCNSLLQQQNSQQMLEQLERTNLFVVALDPQQQWYRYHPLFAEALQNHLQQFHSKLVPTLHLRASQWYTRHNALTAAILHAFSAHEWHWAAQLIERLPFSLAWGNSEEQLVLLRRWLEQLPADIIRTHPRLCLTCAECLHSVTPSHTLEDWLNTAEYSLRKTLNQDKNTPQQQEQKNLLGEVLTFRAWLRSFQESGQHTLALCEQALSLLSPENYIIRAHVGFAQLMAYHASSANDMSAALQHGLHASSLARTANHIPLAANYMGTTVHYMVEAGRLHEAEQLARQTIAMGTHPDGLIIPEAGWPMTFYADILREWNQLDAALEIIQQAIELGKQSGSFALINCAYAILIHIQLSRGDLTAAQTTLEQFDYLGNKSNFQIFLYIRSYYTTIDQVRIWLATGQLDTARKWAERQDILSVSSSAFAYERAEVARIRVLLAQQHPVQALRQLKPVLSRAITGKRWDHVLELWLLRAIAHQMCDEPEEAQNILAEAIQRAEPEGYIRRFVDEGSTIATLLTDLRDQRRQQGPTPYLDTLLAAFATENTGYV